MIFDPIWVDPFWVRSISAVWNFKIGKFQILTIFQKSKNQKFLVVNNSDLIRWPKSDMTTEYRCRSVSGNVRGGSLIFRILDLEKIKTRRAGYQVVLSSPARSHVVSRDLPRSNMTNEVDAIVSRSAKKVVARVLGSPGWAAKRGKNDQSIKTVSFIQSYRRSSSWTS